ncbi:MAG: hypothetical protein AAGC86_06740 [Pseudomonadota bacterium]
MVRLRHWPLAAALLCAVLVWKPIFVGAAEHYNAEVFGSAIRVYAVLRGINAALSVAKETEIGVGLVGSITAQPAMVLDTIDETVARVSDLVFVLAAVSGMLEIAFAPLAQLGAAAVALGFALLYLPLIVPAAASALSGVGRALTGFGLTLALALPLGYGIGGQLGAFWTEDLRAEAERTLQGSADTIEAAIDTTQNTQPQETPADPQVQSPGETEEGWLGSLVTPMLEGYDQARGAAADALAGVAAGVGSAGQAVSDAVPDMASVQARGGEIFESSLTLVAIYGFRLLVLPLVLLWVLTALARRAIAKT